MGLRENVTEALLDAATSPEAAALRHRFFDLRNRLRGETRRVRFFPGFHDPYSYLLAPMVYELPHRWRIEVDWLPLAPPPEGAAEDNREARLAYALADARREAGFLGYPFKRTAYPARECALAALAGTEAARAEGRSELFALTALGAIWGEGGDLRAPALLKQACVQTRVDFERVRRAVENPASATHEAEKNAALVARLGHWAPGTLELDREWFAGHSRFDFLAERLDALGLRR